MKDAPEDLYEILCDVDIFPDPVEDLFFEPEDDSFDDWLLSLANLYGGY